MKRKTTAQLEREINDALTQPSSNTPGSTRKLKRITPKNLRTLAAFVSRHVWLGGPQGNVFSAHVTTSERPHIERALEGGYLARVTYDVQQRLWRPAHKHGMFALTRAGREAVLDLLITELSGSKIGQLFDFASSKKYPTEVSRAKHVESVIAALERDKTIVA